MRATFANRRDKPKSKSRKLEIEKSSELYKTCSAFDGVFEQILLSTIEKNKITN